MKKIGVLGGTFDPVHRGHVSLAIDAKQQAGLDEVMLMPAKKQPFKLNKKITQGEKRIEMLNLAVKYVPGVTVSSVEMDMEGISYTYKTLRELKKSLSKDDEIYFITGTDTYLKLGIWKESEALLKENKFVVGERPGYKTKELKECVKLYNETFGTETIIINNIKIDISATEIRKRLNNNDQINDLVPEGVARYIYDNKLYR